MRERICSSRFISILRLERKLEELTGMDVHLWSGIFPVVRKSLLPGLRLLPHLFENSFCISGVTGICLRYREALPSVVLLSIVV